MRIFITGITGFIGGSLANYFAGKGYQVVGIGRSARLPLHVSKLCKYTQYDITQPIPLINADVVIHAAGLASDTAKFSDLHSVNVDGTRHVLHAANNVGRFIHISSSSVYPFKEGAMLEEEAGLHFNKLSAYGQTKFLAEKMLIEEHANRNAIILRPRAVYGVHDTTLLPRLKRLIKGRHYMLPSNTSERISLTHIQNLILAVELAIKQEHVTNQTFNVADDEVYSLRDVLSALLPIIANRKLHTITIPSWLGELIITANEKVKFSGALNRFAYHSLTQTAVLNTEKIKQHLGYKPMRTFYNSLTELKIWLSNSHANNV